MNASKMPTLLLMVVAALQTGCGAARTIEDDIAAMPMPSPEVGARADGTIFQPGLGLALFEDLKASRVGDILTIRLEENTNATKSSSTSVGKSTSVDSANGTVFGYPLTRDGVPILSGNLNSDQAFSGEGGSSQSNRLEGSVTVTVVRKLPNGNLVISGEKWLTLNQGREYVRVSGIVRPVDIEPDNSVPSEKVANARIAYSGKGALADANQMSWLARFFNSPLLPF